MLGLFRKAKDAEPVAAQASAPDEIELETPPAFPLAANLDFRDGFPMLDWQAARGWMEAFPEEEKKAVAWLACELGWLAHLRDALGPEYRLAEGAGTAIVSSLSHREAKATLEFMERTLKRISGVLEGIARVPEWGMNILLVFDDEDTYYRYVSQFYPERGEFAFSSGMHLGGDCSHFVTTKADLRAIEPVIVHEMTHGCVQHLPLPLWLNEGLAVNTEQRLSGPGSPLHTPREMHAKHLAFWGDGEIQEFWSGDSYRRTDDGNMLSYDLGRILVEHLSGDWARFREFVLHANYEDAGAAAARDHLGVELGQIVAALLECGDGADWGPSPQRWKHLETKTE